MAKNTVTSAIKEYHDTKVKVKIKSLLQSLTGKADKIDLSAVSFSGDYKDLTNTAHTHTKTDITNFPTAMTPTSHRSTGTTYGAGDGSYYGHLKLSAATNSTSGTSGGVAATPSAVKSAYDKAVEAYNLAQDITPAATTILTSGGSIGSAIDSLKTTGGKIILREGSYEIGAYAGYSGYNITAGKTIVIEGMGSGATALRYNGRISTNSGTVIFRNMTVNCANDADITDKASLVFENCVIGKLNGANSEIFNCTNLILSKCELNLDEEGNESYDCYSGIMSSGRVVLDKCTINCNSGTSYSSGLDLNLIYSCAEADISDCKISCSGQNRINLVYSGIPNINNCHIYMPSTRYSICHATTSTDVGGTFTGNYVEMYGSYMRFGAVNGNTFKQLAAGSSSANKMVLQCPTNMMGNNFRGLAVYVDCQSKKCNISYNMADGGITVGSNASGGSAVGNLTY